MPTPLLIWDLDGTLVDSGRDLALACNAARAALGLAALPERTVVGYVGDGLAKLLERLCPEVDPSVRPAAAEAFDAHYRSHCCDHTASFPGIDEALTALTARGWRHAVATNKPLAYTRAILAASGLHRHLAAVRGGDGPRKPEPGQILELMAELQATPASTWVIGDHRTDLAAAAAAGCRAIWCAWGIGTHSGLGRAGEAARPADLVALLDTASPAHRCVRRTEDRAAHGEGTPA